MKLKLAAAALALIASLSEPSLAAEEGSWLPLSANPIFRDRFTADPAPLVVGDRLYLYVGRDEAQRDEMFNMKEWLVYSTAERSQT